MRTLVVYVRPITRRTEQWDALTQRLSDDPAVEDALDIRVWPSDRKDAPWLLTRSPGGVEDYARDLAAALDQWVSFGEQAPDRIVLVGNSIGSVIVRCAWLYGRGQLPEAVGGDQPRPWADAVERIVLVSGINRGFDTRRRNARSLVTKIGASLAGPLGSFVWKDVLAGAAFMTNLRLRWMQHMTAVQEAGDDSSLPLVVQLTGTRDALVKAEDNVDVEGFGRSAQIMVSGSNHADVLDLSDDESGSKYRMLREAVLGDVQRTPTPSVSDSEAEDLVFVVHGIRAGSYGWVKELTERLRREEDGNPPFAVRNGGYRYFSALQFALPPVRRRKVRWFMDRYTEEYARHPSARFHFAGHSNGTYLLGHALRRLPAMRFDRVYLASSVLDESFEWRRLLGDQVSRVRADCASRDIPVAILSNGLPFSPDIGAGGFVGFSQLDEQERSVQAKWIPGGHGAPVAAPHRLNSVAAFLRGAEAPDYGDLEDRTPTLLATLSRGAKVIVALALVLLVVGLLWIATISSPWWALLAAAVLVFVLYVV